MEKAIQNKIDQVWNDFFAGGVANPLTVIEQITYLLFIKGLDDVETNNEQTEQLLGVKFNRIFDEEHQECRWSKFKNMSAPEMYKVVSEKVFPFIKNLQPSKDSSFSRYMESAIFAVPTPLVLEKVVSKIDSIPMKERDTKGDVYEYMLSKLSSSGDLGQFRTPRHIIKMMIEMIKPSPNDIICDPACGSGGFLVETGEYLREKHKEIFENDTLKYHFNNSMFYGFDTDTTMLRLSAMNMMLHGIDNPNINYKDSVSEDNKDEEKYSIILANPPFKGTIDTERTSPSLLKVCNTKKTELLFLTLFLRALKIGGRCACIVPDGVLFGSSNAHKAIRKELIENNKLEAVVSMPSGVFQPYAGVSTAVLVFTKTTTGGTDKVWFYDMQADGYSLDAKRTKISESDIPDIVERFNNLDKEADRHRTDKSFFVTKEEIVNNGYDLSINKYKEIVQEKVEYENPKVILKEIMDMEKEFQKQLKELEELL
ncbi:MAG: SAM-dependent DNA methyltransferase [Bacilli bacterium]|nr:SAM-dependent DNA methyltransferase [Bacilli bacterium]